MRWTDLRGPGEDHSSTFITRVIYTNGTPPNASDAADRVDGRIFGQRQPGVSEQRLVRFRVSDAEV